MPFPHLIYYGDQINENEHAQHYFDTALYPLNWFLYCALIVVYIFIKISLSFTGHRTLAFSQSK